MTGFLRLDDGRRIEYAFVGDAVEPVPDIVLLHEGLGSLAMWRDFPERLARATGRRVLVYSRLGYGRSTPVTAPRTPHYMHDEARIWLPAVLERLDIRAPVLFGHSDGASIALIHAAEPAADVSALVLLAPHVMVEPLSIESIAKARVAYETADLRTRLARYHDDSDSTFWGWNRIWLAPEFRDWNIEGLLESIRVPVLAIQGVDDEYGTLEQIRSIRRHLPATRLLELPDCRHSAHRDQPAAVLEATREFLAGLPRAAAAATRAAARRARR